MEDYIPSLRQSQPFPAAPVEDCETPAVLQTALCEYPQRRRATSPPLLRRCLVFAVRGTVILMFRETLFPLNKSSFFPWVSLCSFFYVSVFFLDFDLSPAFVLLPLETAVLRFSYPPVATLQSTFSTFPMIFSSKMGKMASSSRTSSNTTPQSNSSLTFLK